MQHFNVHRPENLTRDEGDERKAGVTPGSPFFRSFVCGVLELRIHFHERRGVVLAEGVSFRSVRKFAGRMNFCCGVHTGHYQVSRVACGHSE